MNILDFFKYNKLNDNDKYVFDDCTIISDEIIKKLCSSLCFSITTKTFAYVVTHKEHSSNIGCDVYNIFTNDNNIEKEISNSFNKIEEITVNLSKDGIIAFPWNKRRIIDFGNRLKSPGFKWEYDYENHKVILIKPFNIFFVVGGNHSISYGEIFTGGELKCQTEIDYSNFLKNFILNKNGFVSKNGDVIKMSAFMKENYEVALLFQLGKYLV